MHGSIVYYSLTVCVSTHYPLLRTPKNGARSCELPSPMSSLNRTAKSSYLLPIFLSLYRSQKFSSNKGLVASEFRSFLARGSSPSRWGTIFFHNPQPSTSIYKVPTFRTFIAATVRQYTLWNAARVCTRSWHE